MRTGDAGECDSAEFGDAKQDHHSTRRSPMDCVP